MPHEKEYREKRKNCIRFNFVLYAIQAYRTRTHIYIIRDSADDERNIRSNNIEQSSKSAKSFNTVSFAELPPAVEIREMKGKNENYLSDKLD